VNEVCRRGLEPLDHGLDRRGPRELKGLFSASVLHLEVGDLFALGKSRETGRKIGLQRAPLLAHVPGEHLQST
jgi:hypothetical protein